jgi:hypothetical protein
MAQKPDIPIAVLYHDIATNLPMLKFIKPFNFNPKHLKQDVILYMKGKETNDNK